MTKTPNTQTPLSRRLLLLGALPAVVMFIVLIVFFTSARLDDARLDLSQSSQMLADSLAPALEYAVVSGNTRAIEQVLKQSLKFSHAQWIKVVDVTGDPIGSVSADLESLRESDTGYDVYESEILQQPLELDSFKEGEWLQPEYGLGAGALRVGTVQVGVSTNLLAHRQQSIIWTSLAVGLALLFFTMILISHYLSSILAPIRRLSGRINELIGHDYSERPINPNRNSREVAEIEAQLNELAVHLAGLSASRDQTLATSESAREKAEVASKAKSEFLATMSHELRTPLNSTLGMLDLIQQETLNPQQRHFLDTARQSSEDLLVIISDILDYARMDAGQLSLESQTFDLRRVLSNCIATYKHHAQQHGLTLNLDFYGNWPDRAVVLGDQGRVRQVVAGLIDNAVKFTRDGFIDIAVGYSQLDDNCIAFSCSISDSGSGIPVERLREIFNSFEQLDQGNNRAFGGTGLGLSMVQSLVELMGGHIQVETGVGSGSSFRFELPFELAHTEHAPAFGKPTTQPVINGNLRALVVEDNPVNQRVATAMLARIGFVADSASNGKEALELIKTASSGYDIILMDCQMPIMDGYEATQQIRQWEQGTGKASGTPIIALTADVFPGTEAICRNSGMDDFIAKPVRKEKLEELLLQWLQR